MSDGRSISQPLNDLADGEAPQIVEISGHRVSRLLDGLRLEIADVEEVSIGPVTVQVDPGLILSSGNGEEGKHPASVLRIWIDTAVDDDGLNFRREMGQVILEGLKALGR
ncbi:hypothetical protein ABH924_003280 [Arthrobacter sp. GAS37]|uniref:hypothetical protein n=1 Tax=Arthrobacter sp. GAS37 TaxID=3156261 RepID=UPI0038377CF3